MSTSIPISELNTLNQISASDLIAVVQKSTTTTFNTPFQSVGSWISSSIQSSSSLSSESSSYSLSASWSNRSSTSNSASSLIYPNTSTSSYAISASRALSASWAPIQGITAFAISSSFASQSNWAISASFASESISASWSPVPVSSSWSSASLTTTTSSYAINSLYAVSASYVPTQSISNLNIIKAFGTFYATGSLTTIDNQANFIPFSGSYNFISAAYQGYVVQYPGYGGMLSSSLGFINEHGNSYGAYHTWIFYMSNPLPTTNYTIITSIGGEQGVEFIEMGIFPYAARTTTAFSLSMVNNTANWDDRGVETDWISVMILHV